MWDYRIARANREHGNHTTIYFNGWLHDRRVVLKNTFDFTEIVNGGQGREEYVNSKTY